MHSLNRHPHVCSTSENTFLGKEIVLSVFRREQQPDLEGKAFDLWALAKMIITYTCVLHQHVPPTRQTRETSTDDDEMARPGVDYTSYNDGKERHKDT